MKTTLMFFSLLVLPFVVMAEDVEDYSCDKDVVELPIEVTVKSPRLVYVGKYTDNRPVYYQSDSKVVYVYDKNFKDSNGNKMPRMFEWRAENDNRTSPVCPSVSGECNYNQYRPKGIKAYIKSLHVSCGTTELDKNSPNKAIINLPVVSCLKHNNALGTGVKKCCDKLELNSNTKKCDEPALVDPSLRPCSNHTQCTEKKGCFPQREGDVFQADGEETLSGIVGGQMDQWEEKSRLKKIGENCEHARECLSYSCYSGKCENRTVCRLGDKGETAPSGVNCKEGFEKDQYSKCSEGEGHTPFVGMLDSINFELQGQCGFSIDKDQKVAIENAMKSVRSMEWLTSKMSENDPGDCFKMSPWLRNKIGLEMIKTRQTIIQNFSKEILLIEKDYETLKRARADNKTQASMHGIVITEADISSRQSGGWDSLMLMYRKNALFQSYETAMRDLSQKMADLMVNMSLAVVKWQDDHKGPWSYGDGTSEKLFDCPARYEKYDFWGFDWDTKRHDETKNRWMTYYDVKMNVAENKEIINRPAVQEALAAIHQKDTTVIAQMYSGDHGLMDPLNWGAKAPEMHFDRFGSKIDLNNHQPQWQKNLGDTGTTIVRSALALSTLGLSELFGFFNSTREVRYARKLDGSNSGTYKSIHESFKPNILEYYKSLRTDVKVTNFIYEPELNDPKEKDCVDKVDSAECARFKTVMEELNDIAFGQFLAYSYKTADNYKKYFRNEDAGRLLLFHRYATDLHNLNLYYNDIIGKRDTQNKCIEALITNIEQNFDGGSGGINFDSGNYGSGTNGLNGGTGSKRKATGAAQGSRSLNRFHIDLLTGKPMEYQSATYDGVDTNLSGERAFANSGTLAAGAIAARRAKMDAANARALKKGIDVAKREAAVRKALGLEGAGSLAGAGGNSGGNQGGVGSGHKATLDADGSGSGNSNPTGELTDNENGLGSGSSSTGPGSYASDSGGGSSNSSGRDSTGMSDEEKSKMLSNLDRTKGQYNPDEYDGLFKIVSKAYVRNLEKILTRKKEGSSRP